MWLSFSSSWSDKYDEHSPLDLFGLITYQCDMTNLLEDTKANFCKSTTLWFLLVSNITMHKFVSTPQLWVLYSTQVTLLAFQWFEYHSAIPKAIKLNKSLASNVSEKLVQIIRNKYPNICSACIRYFDILKGRHDWFIVAGNDCMWLENRCRRGLSHSEKVNEWLSGNPLQFVGKTWES